MLSRDIDRHLPLDENHLALNEISPLQIEQKSTAIFSFLGGDRQAKALQVDRTLDSDSNGMHNLISILMSLRTL